MTKAPTTIHEAIAQAEASRIASNLSNLASAYVRIGEEMEGLGAELLACEQLRTEILELQVRDPATITFAEVKALYDRTTRRRRR